MTPNFAAHAVDQPIPDAPDPELVRFHQDALCLDIHIHGKDIFSRPVQVLSQCWGVNKLFSPLQPLSVLRRGDVDGGVLAAIGDRSFKHLPRPVGGHLRRVGRQLDKFRQDVQASGGRIVRTAQEIRQAKQDNVLAFVLGMEGAGPIEEGLENLDRLFNAGIRVATIVHFNDNAIGTVPVDFIRYWGKGAQRKRTRGLTAFGEQVIRRMNALGMLIDLSHADAETVLDVTSFTTRPVIASHSGARSVFDFHRYLRDAEIRAIAGTGGVIGIWPMYFIGTGMRRPQDFIAHVAHILALAGDDALAIGTDFQGVPGYMQGYRGLTDMALLTHLLVTMGLSEVQVRKILGLNFLRVLQDVSGAAA